MKKHLTLLGVAAMATAVFAGCSNDEILESYQGEEISFRTRIETRATELKKDNLGDFSVIAKGMHPGGDLYEAYLIGNQAGGEVATKATDSYIWNLGRKVFWPSDMEQVLFWAYTTKHKDDSATDDILSSGTVAFNQNEGPKITGFTPNKADLTADPETGKWNDGDYQKDLLVAFQDQKKSVNNYTSVHLNFQHALSQVSINAIQKGKNNDDNRIVKIKGAWIVNVSNQGDLNAKLETTGEGSNKNFSNNPQWESLNNASGCYGSYSRDPYELGTTATNILGTAKTGSLMIIPQTVSAWNKSDNTTGAYILLLCRVELKHSGATHGDGQYNGSDIYVDGDNHYHQLFPVNLDDKYNEHEYGFTCVQLGANWEMGKKYTYTLDICGEETGAGVYPPEINEDSWRNFVPPTELASPNEDLSSDSKKVIIVNTRPTGKEIGDSVLEDPIQFKVDVGPWTEVTGFNGDTQM